MPKQPCLSWKFKDRAAAILIFWSSAQTLSAMKREFVWHFTNLQGTVGPRWHVTVAWFVNFRIRNSFLYKMPHCVALKCTNQSKTNQDPTIRFLSFPKDKNLRSAWIHAVGRTSLPKDSRLCSKHFEDHCFRDSYLMEVRIMGSSKMRSPLKYDAVPTLFANRPSKAKCSSSEKRDEKRRRLEVWWFNVT